MILTIPYRSDDNNGRELRFAIRSMVMHFKDLTGVCIIGDRPTWYTGEHIPCGDILNHRAWSIVNKLLHCSHETFLMSNDDIFATKPFTSDLPQYYSHTLKEVPVNGRYVTRRNNVMKLFPDGLFYDTHTPMVVNEQEFRECQPKDWHKSDYLGKSLYCNAYTRNPVQLKDYKIRSVQGLPVDLSQPFFSTNERSAKFIKFEEMYPEPSVYEKQGN